MEIITNPLFFHKEVPIYPQVRIELRDGHFMAHSWVRIFRGGIYYLVKVLNREIKIDTIADYGNAINRYHAQCYNVLKLHRAQGIQLRDDMFEKDPNQLPEYDRIKSMINGPDETISRYMQKVVKDENA